MDQIDFRKSWNAFVRWKGWKRLGNAVAKAWTVTANWKGWKSICILPLAVAIPLFVACGVVLIRIFMQEMDQQPWIFGLYGLSAYLLLTLCVKLPTGVKNLGCWLEQHPKLLAVLHNEELKFAGKLYLEQFINFAYGIFKIVSGVIIGSAWIGCDGIYNLVQAWIQLFQILHRRKTGTLRQQWNAYRFCGFLILLMHLSLIGIVFQMVNWNRAEESGEILIIATALFAFYKFISSFVDLAKDRKHTHPVDSSVRMLELSQAIFAIFSLQAGMLHTFGTGESWEHYLNLAVGCAVCLLTVSMGIYMILRANREMKEI